MVYTMGLANLEAIDYLALLAVVALVITSVVYATKNDMRMMGVFLGMSAAIIVAFGLGAGGFIPKLMV